MWRTGKGDSVMLRLTCVVENKASNPALRAEHGLSVLVETGDGRILWDTGASGEVFLGNWHALGLDGEPLDAVALSHAHLDHTGGLAALLKECPGVHTTGTIGPRPYPTGGSPRLQVLDDGRLAPDPFADDMSLILTSGEGVVLLCGCCHAGLRNTLLTVRRLTAQPLRAIVGGTHLRGAVTTELDAIVRLLEEEGRPTLFLNHCTGQKALNYLSRTYRGQVTAFPAGEVLTL